MQTVVLPFHHTTMQCSSVHTLRLDLNFTTHNLAAMIGHIQEATHYIPGLPHMCNCVGINCDALDAPEMWSIGNTGSTKCIVKTVCIERVQHVSRPYWLWDAGALRSPREQMGESMPCRFI